MKSRLRKNLLANSYNDPSGYCVTVLVPDIDKKIINKDKIDGITYGPSISREWDFEKPIDNPEWNLRSDFVKKI